MVLADDVKRAKRAYRDMNLETVEAICWQIIEGFMDERENETKKRILVKHPGLTVDEIKTPIKVLCHKGRTRQRSPVPPSKQSVVEVLD